MFPSTIHSSSPESTDAQRLHPFVSLHTRCTLVAPQIGWPNREDRFLAYLPLAHIMELVAEMAVYSVGGAVRTRESGSVSGTRREHASCRQLCGRLAALISLPGVSPQIGYGHPQTLSDVGLKLAPGTRGDAIMLRPTFMVFPPTVLDRVRQGIQAKADNAGALGSYLFSRALVDGVRDFDGGKIGPPPLWNAAVFKKAQAALGGCVQVMITGSAPLSHETQKFIQTVFNCPVRGADGFERDLRSSARTSLRCLRCSRPGRCPRLCVCCCS